MTSINDTTSTNNTKDDTMTTKFHGVIPPVVTPLTTNGDLDVPSYEKLINRLLGQGVDGLFVLGSTSEVAFFDDEMRGRVLAEAKRIINGRVPLLAGVIDTETSRVMAQMRAAERFAPAGFVAGMMSRSHLFEADAPVQKGRHRHLVGGVEHGGAGGRHVQHDHALEHLQVFQRGDVVQAQVIAAASSPSMTNRPIWQIHPTPSANNSVTCW